MSTERAAEPLVPTEPEITVRTRAAFPSQTALLSAALRSKAHSHD